MKPTTKVLSLSLVLAGILTLWLVPKMNKANDLGYVRVIEDTNPEPKVIVTPLATSDSTSEEKKSDNAEKKSKEKRNTKGEKSKEKNEKGNKSKKKYKKEIIKSDYTWKDIDSKMYSRAIHFEPLEEFVMDTIAVDSLENIP